MKIIRGKTYRIKGNSDYFKGKYGTANPEFWVEAPTKEIWKGDWMVQDGNPACMLYGMRSGIEKLPSIDTWYGKIGSMGEIVHESELEEI